MSCRASNSGRRYGSTFACRSPGRKPRRSPASTAGRVSTIRATSRFISAETAMATARNDLPVPAGPIAKTMSCFRIASTYRFWPGVFGVIHFFRDGTAIASLNTALRSASSLSDSIRSAARTSIVRTGAPARTRSASWTSARSAFRTCRSSPLSMMSWPRATMRMSSSCSSVRRWSSLRPRRGSRSTSGASEMRRVIVVASLNSWVPSPSLSLGWQIELDVQLLEALRRHRRRRLHQEILRLLVHRERDHLADVALAGNEHDDSIDARRRAPVGRRAEPERVQHPAEARLHLLAAVPGDGERLVHDLGPVVPDRATRELDPVAHDVVLIGFDRERVLRLQGLETALGHRERVVTELDPPGLLVQLVHREVGHPAEPERVLLDEAELLAELVPHLPREPVGRGTLLANEEKHVAVDRLGRRAESAEVRRVEEFRDRPPRPALRERHVAETWRALLARPLSQLVEEAAGLRHPLWRAHGADDRAPGDRGREHREPGVTEGRRDVADRERIAQVRLVGAVFQNGLVERDPGERRRCHRALRTEFLEHAVEDRLDRREHVLLGDERHLEVELVELARRPIGAAVLVTEARGDLEVAIEPGDHEELLELLRRLRQRVELPRVDTARHEVVARTLGGARREDRRLELGEPGRDHSPADRRDDMAPQQHVPVELLPPEVEEAVAEARLLRILGGAADLDRQGLGDREGFEVLDGELDLPRGKLGVHGLGRAGHHRPGHRDDALETEPFGRPQVRARSLENALGQTVVVAEVDEQKAAVVALPVDPAREPRRRARVRRPELAARVGPVAGQRVAHAPPPRASSPSTHPDSGTVRCVPDFSSRTIASPRASSSGPRITAWRTPRRFACGSLFARSSSLPSFRSPWPTSTTSPFDLSWLAIGRSRFNGSSPRGIRKTPTRRPSHASGPSSGRS